MDIIQFIKENLAAILTVLATVIGGALITIKIIKYKTNNSKIGNISNSSVNIVQGDNNQVNKR